MAWCRVVTWKSNLNWGSYDGMLFGKGPALDRVNQHVQKWIWVVFTWYRLIIFRKYLLLTLLLKSADFFKTAVLSFLFKIFDESINNMDFLKKYNQCSLEVSEKLIQIMKPENNIQMKNQTANHRLENRCVLTHISIMNFRSWTLLGSRDA